MVFCARLWLDIGCQGGSRDHDGRDSRYLEHAYPASREGVLQALANGDADTHRLLHHNDVGQRQGKEEEGKNQHTDKPGREHLARVFAQQTGVHRRQKSGNERCCRAPIKKTQPALGVRRFAQALLDPHRRKKASDQDVRQDLSDRLKTVEDCAEPGNGAVIAQRTHLQDHCAEGDDGKRKSAQPLYGSPYAIVASARRKRLRKEAPKQKDDDRE